MSYWHGSTTSELGTRVRSEGRRGELFPCGLGEPKGMAGSEDAGMGSSLGLGSYPIAVLHPGKRD